VRSGGADEALQPRRPQGPGRPGGDPLPPDKALSRAEIDELYEILRRAEEGET